MPMSSLRYLITVAVRAISANKMFSIINIGGLAIGLAACLMIFLFVHDELSYDQWIADADRIFQLQTTFENPGNEPMLFSRTMPMAGPALEKYFPNEIESSFRLRREEVVLRKGDFAAREQVSYVDPEFINFFNLMMTAGAIDGVFSENTKIVISDVMALKYFGDQSPLGQIVLVDDETSYEIVGVFENFPHNSHLSFDFIAMFDMGRYHWMEGLWTSVTVYTYVKFANVSMVELVEANLPDFIASQGIRAGSMTDFVAEEIIRLNFLNVRDIHLQNDKSRPLKAGGNYHAVISFSLVALLILVLAVINFTNLAGARALRRIKEMALHKIVGASRIRLISQLIVEAVLMAILAFTIALVLVELVLPTYNEFVGKQLTLFLLDNIPLLILMTGIVVFIGLVAGTYPATMVSRYRPINFLRNDSAGRTGGHRLRQFLVTFQFSVSIALIISTIVINNQVGFARDLDFGFSKKNRVSLRNIDDFPGDETTVRVLMQELLAIPGIVQTGTGSDTLPMRRLTTLDVIPDGSRISTNVDQTYVGGNYFDVFDVKVLGGRVFSEAFTDDFLVVPEDQSIAATRNMVVNESFLRTTGIEGIEAAIGRQFTSLGYIDNNRPLISTIIGVVPDMKMRSVRELTRPKVFYTSATLHTVLFLKLKSDDLTVTLSEIDRVWQNVVPTIPINRSFVEDDFDALYAFDEARGDVFAIFSLFAVFVACLGLFGLATFEAEHRTKEIGIRKVLGARIRDILFLLSWKFVTPVLVANLVAWPVAYYFSRGWLEEFAYRIDLGLMPFVSAAVLAICVAWATVGIQAYRVARANPIYALRNE